MFNLTYDGSEDSINFTRSNDFYKPKLNLKPNHNQGLVSYYNSRSLEEVDPAGLVFMGSFKNRSKKG